MNWQPSASPEVLRRRAELLASIRAFFAERGVIEVETPLLATSGVTDPSIEPFVASASTGSSFHYLQTSPEYAMKRLLAAHGKPVYQVCKAFREGEAGPRHNPEFSLLEWYRPGFDHHMLMNEVAELVASCLGQRPLRKVSYRELFLQELALDPFTASEAELKSVTRQHLDTGDLSGECDMWLDLLMSHLLEPRLQGMCFVYDYPASQAALSRIVSADGVKVGQRFELYVDGMELANGYCELTDAGDQRHRFNADNALRKERGQPERPLDEYLLGALEHGLGECSGVALGVDRLLMLLLGATHIREVLAFDWERI